MRGMRRLRRLRRVRRVHRPARRGRKGRRPRRSPTIPRWPLSASPAASPGAPSPRRPSSRTLQAAVREPVRRRQGPGDPFSGELRRRDVLPLLVMHLMVRGPSYGNQLMDRISELTEGVLSVNPNTMYPLLRQLESRGLIEGRWEHPERRSRRYYSLTAEGKKEYRRLRKEVRPFLDSVGAVDRRDRARGLWRRLSAVAPRGGRRRGGVAAVDRRRALARVRGGLQARRARERPIGRRKGARSSGSRRPAGAGTVSEKVIALRAAAPARHAGLRGRDDGDPGRDVRAGRRTDARGWSSSSSTGSTQAGFLRQITDVLFIRRALAAAIDRTLHRFATEAEDEAAL